MNKISRLTALLLALMMIFSTFAAAETTYSVGGMTAEQWQQLVDDAESELFGIDEGDSGKTITPESPEQAERGDYYPYADGTTTPLIISEEATSAPRTESGVAVLTHAAEGQWQMLVGDVWADLSGETGMSLWVTPGMMHGMSAAEFRKALLPKDEAGEYTAFTQVAEVSVVSGLPATLSAVSREDASTGDAAAEENAAEVYSLQRANESLQKNLITIEYRFQSNGDVAATPYYAEVSTTTNTFSATVKHPTIVGYQPVAEEKTLPQGFEYDTAQVTITDAAIDGDVTIIVYYEPAEVKFTVNFWAEKAVYTTDPATNEDVKYDLIESQEFTGYTEAAVKDSYPADAAEQYFATLHAADGFKALLYDENVKIAADGSTVVDVYYQRLYYLMVFNLGGGSGVNPVYARHGAPVGTISTPTRPGYTHKGWTLDPDKTVYTDDYSDFATIPATVPIGNVTYYAVWQAVEVDFVVQYWLEDANATGAYLPWYTELKRATTDATVKGADYTTVTNTEVQNQNELQYYHLAKYDESAVVAGDGSTTLNVYYDRNSYTLRFYYARSYVENGIIYYQVATSTDGSSGSGENVDHEDASWNGEYTVKPQIADIYTEQTRVDGDYTYYFFDLTAKYGQNIESVWPNAPITNEADISANIKFVSWGTQAASGYNQANSNNNIKGVYSIFDAKLLTGAAKTAEQGVNHWMVAYWANPTTYTYEIYYTLLDDETADRDYNGVNYKKVAEYFVGSTDRPSGQSPLSFEGVVYVGKDFDGTDERREMAVRFYYARNTHVVTFNNLHGGQTKAEVSYGEVLTVLEDTEPIWPEGYEGIYTFDGWYVDEACKTAVDFTTTMPDNALMFYAKWTPIKHTVTVYNSEEDAVKAAAGDTTITPLYQWVDKVSHGSPVASAYDYGNKDQYDPETQEFPQPTRPGYNFALWYYYSPEDNSVQPFSFNATPIVQDTVAFAGWTADSLASYTIYYVKPGTAADAVDNPDNWVAEPTYGSGLAGAATTERAKGGTELYDAFQTGYFPTLESHSFTLDVDAAKNVYVFEYVMAENVPYKVQYLEAGTNKVLATEKLVTTNDKAVVTENYVQVGGNYVPDAFQKRLVLKSGTSIEDNVIVFYYTKDVKRTTVEVNHYLLHADNPVPELYNSVKEIVTLPYKHTVTPETIANYAYDSSRTTRQVGSSAAVLNSSLEINLQENAEGVVLNLYYVEETVTINYVAVGPANATNFGTVSPTTETVGKVTGAPGSMAIAGDGYKFVGWYSDAACTVRVGEDAAFTPEKVNGVHVEATYYAKFEHLPGQLDITKVVVNNMDEALVDAQFVFDVKLTDVNGGPLAGTVEYSIGDQQYTATLQDGSFTLTLDFGTVAAETTSPVKTASIANLPYGVQYVVTETPVDNCTTTVENVSGAIPAGETVTAAFTNTFPAVTVSTLTVKKVGMNNGESAIFEVKLETGTYMVVLNSANQSEAILNVPIGSTYTVTELNSWSWRYANQEPKTGTVQKNGNEVVFTNNRTDNQWMSDESWVENNATEGKQTNSLNNQ